MIDPAEVHMAVHERIDQIVKGTTDTQELYTVLWVGKHLFLAKRKGTKYWSSMMEPSKYSPASLRLYEINGGKEWYNRGELKELHPKDVDDKRRLTKSIEKECIEIAKKEDELYPQREKERLDAEKEEEDAVNKAKRLVVAEAAKWGFRGGSSSCYSDGVKKWRCQLSFTRKIALGENVASLLGSSKVKTHVEFSLEVGDDDVCIQVEVSAVGGTMTSRPISSKDPSPFDMNWLNMIMQKAD